MSTAPLDGQDDDRSPDELALDKALAEAIRRLRSNRRWSQDRLAQESGMSKKTVSRIETAQISMRMPQMLRISTALDTTLGDLWQAAKDLQAEGFGSES